MAMVVATHGHWIHIRYVQMSMMEKIMLTYALPPVKRTCLGRFLVPAEGKDQESGNMIEEAQTNL